MSTASMQHHATAEGAVPACEPAGAAQALTWEWRSFDYHPQLWRAALLRGVRAGPGSMTAETYLLAGPSPDSVKLRHDRVEVKQAGDVSPAGLERWKPVVSEPFPLSRRAMEMSCAAWRRRRVDVHPVLLTPADLASYLYAHLPDVRVIPLRKWRRAYRVHGCMVERTTVLVGGDVLESLSFEHPDADRLAAVLRSLDLSPDRNTSYVTRLKQMVGLRV